MKEAHTLIGRYMSSGKFKTVENINQGSCERFANDLVVMVGVGRVVFGGEFGNMGYRLKDEPYGYGGHYVALINEKLYDAENPDGVDHPDELEIYIRSKKDSL